MLLSLLLTKNGLTKSSFIVEEDWLFEASSVDAINGASKLEEEQDEIQRIQAKEKEKEKSDLILFNALIPC